jgi:hypothetical protein
MIFAFMLARRNFAENGPSKRVKKVGVQFRQAGLFLKKQAEAELQQEALKLGASCAMVAS